MYEKIQEYGWTGTFLGAEPWGDEEGEVGIKTAKNLLQEDIHFIIEI